MKKFRFDFSKTAIILIISALILTGAGIYFNLISVVEYTKISVFKALVYSITMLISLGLFALILSLALNGCYVIKNGYLYSCFGFIRTKVKLEDILSITYFKKSKKLVLFFASAEYSAVIISQKYYDDFVKTLKEANPRIIFDQSEEEKTKNR